MTGTNKVVDDVRGRGVSSGTAKPLRAQQALHDA